MFEFKITNCHKRAQNDISFVWQNTCVNNMSNEKLNRLRECQKRSLINY